MTNTRISYRLFLLGPLLLLFSAAINAVEVKDDMGNRVVLAKPASRIVSLAPHLTEILFAAGAGNTIVGAVSYSDYPTEAKSIPRIGGYNRLNIEAIIRLKPDLVIAWKSGNSPSQLEVLQQMGIKVYFSEPHVLEDIAHSMKIFGVITGHKEAEESAETFLARLTALRQKHRNDSLVRVFYQVWNKPLRTVGGTHSISEVIQLCGGQNIFSDLHVLAPVVNLESVIRRNPEVIVASGMGESRPDWLNEWNQWPQLQAVQRQQLFFIPPELVQRHGPRIIQGAELLCKQLDQVRNSPKQGN